MANTYEDGALAAIESMMHELEQLKRHYKELKEV